MPRPMARQSGQLEAAIRHLASISRPSASEGEREAAEWLAGELRAAGCRDVRVEEERAHGTYWWPLGLLTGIAALGGLAALRGRRLARRPGRSRRPGWPATSAAAHSGSAGASCRTARPGTSSPRPATRRRGRRWCSSRHHDAAHSGLVFHPAIPRYVADHFPGLLERSDTTPPVMFPVFAGPVAVAVGSALGAAEPGARRHRPRRRQRGELRRHRRAGRGPRRQRQPDRRGHGPGRRAGARRAAGRRRSAYCSYRPARRSPSWRACTASPAATSRHCRPRTRASCASTRSARAQLIVLEAEGMLVMRPYAEELKVAHGGVRGGAASSCAAACSSDRDRRPDLAARRLRHGDDRVGQPRHQASRPTTTGRPTRPTTCVFETVDDAVEAVRRRHPPAGRRSQLPRQATSPPRGSVISPGELRLLELARAGARAPGPASMPSSPRELVAAHERRAAAARARQAQRVAEHLARELEVRGRSPRRPCARAWRGGRRRESSVTSTSTGRAGSQVAVDGAARERALVDEEAEAQVVAGERGDVGAQPLAGAQARQRPPAPSRPPAVVARGRSTRAVGRPPASRGLATSCSSAPQRSASPRVSSSASGSASTRRSRARRARPSAARRVALERRSTSASTVERVVVDVEVVVARSARRRAARSAPAARRSSAPTASSSVDARRRGVGARGSGAARRRRAPPATPAQARGGRARAAARCRRRRAKPELAGEPRPGAAPAADRRRRRPAPTIRRRRGARSAAPPSGSTSSPPASGSAIALTVKSRGARSSSIDSPAQRGQVDLPARRRARRPARRRTPRTAGTAVPPAARASARAARAGSPATTRSKSSAVSRPSSRSRTAPPTSHAGCRPAPRGRLRAALIAGRGRSLTPSRSVAVVDAAARGREPAGDLVVDRAPGARATSSAVMRSPPCGPDQDGLVARGRPPGAGAEVDGDVVHAHGARPAGAARRRSARRRCW